MHQLLCLWICLLKANDSNAKWLLLQNMGLNIVSSFSINRFLYSVLRRPKYYHNRSAVGWSFLRHRDGNRRRLGSEVGGENSIRRRFRLGAWLDFSDVGGENSIRRRFRLSARLDFSEVGGENSIRRRFRLGARLDFRRSVERTPSDGVLATQGPII